MVTVPPTPTDTIAQRIARLAEGYFNSDDQTPANPGGMGDDGHTENLPVLLVDVGMVARHVGANAASADAAVQSVTDARDAAEQSVTALADGAAGSAAAASASAADAAASATAAGIGADNAAASAAAAAASAAGVNLPPVTPDDAGKVLTVTGGGQVAAVVPFVPGIATAAAAGLVKGGGNVGIAADGTMNAAMGLMAGGTLIATRPVLNLIPGLGVSIEASDNPAAGRVDVVLRAAAPSGVTLDPANKGADAALSADKLTASPAQAHTQRGGVRATIGRSSGKLHFEVAGGWREGSGIGFVSPAVNLSTTDIMWATGVACLIGYPDGTSIARVNGASTTLSGASLYGDHVKGITVDLDTRKWWVAINGVYQYGGNPLTGANSLPGLPLTGIIYPLVHIRVFPGETITTKFSYLSWQFPPPVGFNQWM